MNFIIDDMKKEDWDQVANIYMDGVKTARATFVEEVPVWENWNKGHVTSCRLVARSGKDVLGWVALSPTSTRFAYRGVAEVSIYVGEKYRGMGVGEALMKRVIECSEQNGFWTLESLVISENKGSIELHKKCGFRVLGVREKPGKMASTGIWYDVTIMERRSKEVGID